MENRLKKHTPEARTTHRLDMDTSGILLFAKDAETHRAISKQFEQRQTQKRYIALVWGHVAKDNGTVDLPLICDWPNRPRQMVDHDIGKPSQTQWHVIERTLSTTGHPITRVKLTPITGRSHQLRVHMLELGHPILGDDLYAHDQALQASSRLMLHAEMLSFTHPTTGHTITCTDGAPF